MPEIGQSLEFDVRSAWPPECGHRWGTVIRPDDLHPGQFLIRTPQGDWFTVQEENGRFIAGSGN